MTVVKMAVLKVLLMAELMAEPKVEVSVEKSVDWRAVLMDVSMAVMSDFGTVENSVDKKVA